MEWERGQGRKKQLLILDGQGGGVGRRIAEQLLEKGTGMQLMVVGSNGAATANMMKAGIGIGATGENAWIYNCARADLIVGPIGVILANAMHGEISPKMALAVADSPGRKILLPVAHHHVAIAGLPELTLGQYLEELVRMVGE